MDSDFHYYGTGTAALKAGFSKDDATLIANVAQYVDWFDSNYWSYWNIVDENGKPIKNKEGKQYQYNYPQLSVQTIDAKMAVDYDKDIWNAFHFPPGNLNYGSTKKGWEKQFQSEHKIRTTNLKSKADRLCRPFSQFAYEMINDTIDLFLTLKHLNSSELAAWVESYLGKGRVRCPVTDAQKLIKFILGIRMHVLADTWAHQDFTGASSKSINGAGMMNKVVAKDASGVYQKTTWTGTAWVFNSDTDCAAAPTAYSDKACSGHGQVGHFPDYSWLSFKYPAAWSKESLHERNNLVEYDQAWKWLSFVMERCLKNVKTVEDTPSEIKKVMSTWHLLSDRGLVVVSDSEALWKKTSLGQQLPDRWDPNHRKKMGLYDGVAKTRYGYINIVKESNLHYMELASSIHYQFCYKFFNKTNTHYTWKPQTPRT